MLCRKVDCTGGNRVPTRREEEAEMTKEELADANNALVRTVFRWLPVPTEELTARAAHVDTPVCSECGRPRDVKSGT